MTTSTDNSGSRRRVVVTGMGCLTPAGNGVGMLWDSLINRRSAIREDPQSDPPYQCRWSAPVASDCRELPAQAGGWAGGDPTTTLMIAAADQALRQAGWRDDDVWGRDVGVIVGTGAGPSHALHDAYKLFVSSNGRRMRPTTVPRCMTNSLSAHVAIGYRLTGPNYTVVSACSSSTVAIGMAYRMIRCGFHDRMVCGGVDTVLEPVYRKAWDRLGVLSRGQRCEDTVRPFDRHRDGFVLGDGSGALVLESEDRARNRNAAILGEIAGYGETSDATHITQPDPEGQRRAMQYALDDAGMEPGLISLIVAHGTATQANDRAEAQALHHLFGGHLRRIPVLALKPLWGHTLGASGAIESIACLLSLSHGCIPPDPLLHRDPDPDIALRFAPKSAQSAPLDSLIKNSFAFGGNNAVLVFRAACPSTDHIPETSHGP